MTKRLLTLLTALMALTAPAAADMHGDWKLHPTFDYHTKKVIDTPDRVFFQALGQQYAPTQVGFNTEYPFLFVYEKADDELTAYTKRNRLSSNLVSYMDYNPKKRYLIAVYDDYNIDIIYDNGNTYNIPDLMQSILPAARTINRIIFDSDNDRVYIATDFGYIAINDSKYEIAESKVFNRRINSAARIADRFVLFDEEGVLSAPMSAPRQTLADYTRHTGLTDPMHIMPLYDGRFACTQSGKGLYKVTLSADVPLAVEEMRTPNYELNELSYCRDGFLLNFQTCVAMVSNPGSLHMANLPSEKHNARIGSWDYTTFWQPLPRKGLVPMSVKDNKWTHLREPIVPNAPSAFMCRDIVYSDRYGMLARNHGVDIIFTNFNMRYPDLICSYRNGEWKPLSYTYLRPELQASMGDPRGIAVDPVYPQYIYCGSRFYGMMRLNPSDVNDVLHMSHPKDRGSSLPGYVQIRPDNKIEWNEDCIFSQPSFDRDGVMWAAYLNSDVYTGELWYWTPEARKNVTAANFNASSWGKIVLTGHNLAAMPLLLAMKSVPGILVVAGGNDTCDILVIDTNGTPSVTSDDRKAVVQKIVDQDNASVDHQYLYFIKEDPDTGLIWVGTSSGIFTINPRTIFDNPSQVARIKVARNDGTNLADYLLDGVSVTDMAIDGQKRKWFATDGGGVVGTSADGREVIAQFTADRTYIPSDHVYAIGYNPESNSLLMSTESGMAEFMLPGASSGEGFDAVRAFPNPVRPDYLGWVTIDGLTDGAVVKITDASGNLVKELERPEGGRVQWDTSNISGKRVNSGVYYVMASSGPGDSNLAKVTKILVVN